MKRSAAFLAAILIMSAFAALAPELQNGTDPHLDGSKTIAPATIFKEGAGSPDKAKVNITITGDGTPLVQTFPQDVVFAIDSSGSMAFNDPFDERLTAAKYYVDQLKKSLFERGAVVDFDDNAFLVGNDHLGWNYNEIKSNIDTIDNVGGTDIPAAMTIANDELIYHGWDNHTQVIILLTDGQNYCYEPPYYGTPCPRLDNMMNDVNDPLVKEAINNNIMYFTIGLGPSVDAALLGNLANMTGGSYHPAATAGELQAVYDEIHQEIMNIAGNSVVVTEELTAEFDYVAGSFSKTPSSLIGKKAVWNIPSLSIDETWTVTFDVSSETCGSNLKVDGDTNVTYTAFDSTVKTVFLSSVYVTVIGCNNPPAADCSGPYSGDEGSPVPLSASGSYDPDGAEGDYIASYEWDLDGDGLYDDDTGATTSGTWGDNGDFTIGVKVTDTWGESDTDSCLVHVDNVAPAVLVNTPFVYTMSQGSNTWVIPAVEGSMSPSDFYSYYSASAHTGFEKPYQSFIYLYREVTDPTGEVGLFIVHDIDGDVYYPGAGLNSGSPDAESWMDVSGIPTGAYLAQSDDPAGPGSIGEFQYFPASGTAQGRWHWWYNTDGGAIGGLTSASAWCITIDPLYWKDVGTWAYYYTGGSHIDLDMGAPVQICFTPSTEPSSISILEGGTVGLSGFFDDPGWEDTHTALWDFDDGTTAGAAFSPGAGYTHHLVEPVTHTFGDEGTYAVCLSVEDDDGGLGSDCIDIIVGNGAPKLVDAGPFTVDEGSPVTVALAGSDPGSDDLEFTWEFEDGPTATSEKYNDGIASEPDYDASTNAVRTPGGTYPFMATGSASHTYCDNGIYGIDLALEDDDGGMATRSTSVEVRNVAPKVTAINMNSGAETVELSFGGVFSDPGCDTWVWWWDFMPAVDTDSDGDPTNDADVSGTSGITGELPAASYTFNDDYDGDVYLWVRDDDGGLGFDTAHVDIGNEAPTASDISAFTLVDVTLRVAGEKWHDVTMYLYDDVGALVGQAGVVRYPGSPDDQSVTITGLVFDVSRSYSITVVYTPPDDPVNGQPNGANPAWLIFDYENGTRNRVKLHHTFNVNHPDTWIWEPDITPYVRLAGQSIHFKAQASDAGSDDLTFEWNFGDWTPTGSTTHLNGPTADPYPSYWYGAAPFGAEDEAVHAYAVAGSYTVLLTVRDDDGGLVTVTMALEIF